VTGEKTIKFSLLVLLTMLLSLGTESALSDSCKNLNKNKNCNETVLSHTDETDTHTDDTDTVSENIAAEISDLHLEVELAIDKALKAAEEAALAAEAAAAASYHLENLLKSLIKDN
tara:strand:- start:101 stop:448 length:348 start_codon:yes stop_codon:yes gene_type:complete